MSDSLISSLDDLRRQHPSLGFCLYAMEPGGLVTLEVHTPDGGLFSWKAASEAEAIAQAFPEAAPQTCPNTGLVCVPGCDRKTCAGLHVPLAQWPEPEADPAPEPPADTDIFS